MKSGESELSLFAPEMKCAVQIHVFLLINASIFPGILLQSILLACLVSLENGRTWILALLMPVGTPNGETTLSQDNTNVNGTHRTHAIVNITLFAIQYGRQLCDIECITSIGVTILRILHALLQTEVCKTGKQQHIHVYLAPIKLARDRPQAARLTYADFASIFTHFSKSVFKMGARDVCKRGSLAVLPEHYLVIWLINALLTHTETNHFLRRFLRHRHEVCHLHTKYLLPLRRCLLGRVIDDRPFLYVSGRGFPVDLDAPL